MLQAGILLGDRYAILELIGSGGMADVYKARDTKLNRLVAVKVLKAEFCEDTSFIAQFKAEAQAAACLMHPNVVNIYDVGDVDEIHYIVMEMVEGVTLKQYIEKRGKLEIKESIGITIQIAQGIGAAHEHHIIHRDIKPQNIILSKDGKVKVTDFGIAKIAAGKTLRTSMGDGQKTQTRQGGTEGNTIKSDGDAVGSVYYFSPEQAQGKHCDEKSDIYSLGITLYEMLTGQVPFTGETTVAIALAHIQSEMVPPHEVDPMIPISLDRIILKATQKKPERRYASASELIADLRKALLTPDEDFIKVMPANTTTPTVLISDDDIESIRQSKKIDIPEEDEEEREESTARDRKAYEELDDEEGEEDNPGSLFDKIIFAIGIIAAAAILGLAVYMLAKALKLMNDNPETEPISPITTITSTEPESTTISAKETYMPLVTGLTVEKAVSALNKASLGYKLTEAVSDTVDKNLIISQEFDEGTILAKHTTVSLVVSAGTDKVTLPDSSQVIGKSFTQVNYLLRQLGLEVVRLDENHNKIEKGNVIDMDPLPGESVKKGTTVRVYVSLGKKIIYVSMPSILNMTVEQAQKTLDDADTHITILDEDITEEYNEQYAEGLIFYQSISTNTTIEQGTRITIKVSKGSEYVLMPELLGMTEKEAKKALEELGLEIGTIEEEYDNEKEYGTVLDQEISPLTKVKLGSKVGFTVCQGKEMIKLPEQITGVEAEKLIKWLEDAGFEVEVTEQESNTVMAGYVINASAEGGKELPYGASIKLTVAIEPPTTTPAPTEPPTTTVPPTEPPTEPTTTAPPETEPEKPTEEEPEETQADKE